MKICLAGKNNIAVEILETLLKLYKIEKSEILILCNKNDEGIDSWQKSLKKFVKENNLVETTLSEVYNIEDLIFLSLEFDQIIKPEKFKTKNLYNIHFSLLPAYKGMYTSIMPILYNEMQTGVTLHYIDKGIDTGNIIDQIKIPIDRMDNSRDIYSKYIKNGISLVQKYLERILLGEVIPSKIQDAFSSSYFSKRSIDFSKIEIDLQQTAIHIHNHIRAFNFREYQIPELFSTKVLSSEILTSSSSFKPGTKICEDSISFTLSTLDYDLKVFKDRVEELFLACKVGDITLLEELINIPKILDVQNSKGWTPLIVAVYNNNVDIVEKLIKNGANVFLNNFNGTTPFMYAKSAYYNHKETRMLEILYAANIDIYEKDFNNKNVIDYCIENNEIEVLEIIRNLSK